MVMTTGNFGSNPEQYSTDFGTVEIQSAGGAVHWSCNVGGVEHTGSVQIDDKGEEWARLAARRQATEHLLHLHAFKEEDPDAPDTPDEPGA